MIDGKDDKDAQEEARQRPASNGSAPQSPGGGRDGGKEGDEAGVGDQIPAGVDPLVPNARRGEPGFIRKARISRNVTHMSSLEATWFSEAAYVSPAEVLRVQWADM
jgi:hypothetical protein